MRTVFTGRIRLVPAMAGLLSVLMLSGCTTIKYSYDMKTHFSERKSYAWVAPSLVTSARDPLLETNVQVLVDQVLTQKGFIRVSEKPDLMVSMGYEFDSGNVYQLQMLTLSIYRPIPGSRPVPETSVQRENSLEKSELVWQGTALSIIGAINTDAASDDLKRAVEKILLKFPPK